MPPRRPPAEAARVWLAGWALTAAGLGVLWWAFDWRVAVAVVLLKAGHLMIEDAGR